MPTAGVPYTDTSHCLPGSAAAAANTTNINNQPECIVLCLASEERGEETIVIPVGLPHVPTSPWPATHLRWGLVA